MSRRLRLMLAVTAAGATAGLAFLLVFLLRQGLGKASMWATFLVLPLTVVVAVAGVWAAVVAARGSREDRSEATDQNLEKSPIRPSVARSGDIHQEHTAGPSIAHTGAGDIIFARPETVESPDESV
jgi:high-affinity Fe2+/Pb2+ permease